MISIILLTFNDELNIRNTLESIKDLSNDIIIIDSYSNDRTEKICSEYNVSFYKNEFINQAIQFNWALDNLKIKNEWVLRLDSDEVLTEKIKSEIISKTSKKNDIYGYYMNRKMFWMGKWLKFGRMYPHYILRLFKKGYARYEEKTEEHLLVRGKTEKLDNFFYEDNKKNNLRYFTEKHLNTADGELNEILSQKENNDGVSPNLFGNKVERTRWLKLKIFNKTPLFIRSLNYFIYRYFICLGFLDGKPGLIFHFLQGFWYRFYIDSLVYEKTFNKNK